MTDRLNALTVVLDRDLRTDDAEPLIAAIRQLRGVLDVVPHVADPGAYAVEARIRSEIGKDLFAVIYPERRRD